ncbi:MAG: cobyrinate a,c-diamide synthase [Desulfomonilaceae bacterium]|nr:cobyrinate a,c-diamide synthase [Desulfomonilaceae bacterium]
MSTTRRVPRAVIAALKGGAGKTFITVGLVAALKARGLSVGVFKKGPDYIDAGWLGLCAGAECYNLDSYLFSEDIVRASFLQRSIGRDIAMVEGNRGLFDGVDAQGNYSTAELAKLLAAPVILIVDATKMTRTAAALVVGCRALDPAMEIKAVILNRVAGARHERVLREAIEGETSIPVIGSVKKMPLESFPQRHLGLLPLYEHPKAAEFVQSAARVVETSVDLDRLIRFASTAKDMEVAESTARFVPTRSERVSGLRIGVLRDSAFQFYYPENLEALQVTGVELVEISALEPVELPELDCLYIGGGFPETHSDRLAGNLIFKESLRRAVEGGLPVYAECGGLMYLSRNLLVDDNVYPMAGVFPVDTVLERRPQGHGYIRAEVARANPFYPLGTIVTGHEFHYSYVTAPVEKSADYAFKVLRGHGMDGHRDGIRTVNALGTYIHVHALGTPQWAEGLLDAAAAHRSMRAASVGFDNRGDDLKVLP